MGSPGGRGGTRFRQGGGRRVFAGGDQEARIALSLADAAHGGRRSISLRDPRTGRDRTLAVQIPRGVRPGQRIRLAGQGESGGDGGPAGHLYLQVELEPDADFVLDGDDLYTVLPVAPWTAALGGEARLRTLDGAVKVKIPAGSSSGRQIRLAGKGFPSGKNTAGDLYAEIRIVVPPELSAAERELAEKWAAASHFNAPPQHAPRPGPGATRGA
jgi:curved DNA-binding protein